ncbi:MAG: tRNA (adenosine(37)-N6)-threonylcarbamoyltransferase complex ATPase subunit type 1 TsaE [Gammaproteobacteria bacterium]
MLQRQLTIADAGAMQRLGHRFAGCCPPGGRIYLQGALGSGKTTFVRGFLRGMDYQEKVKSPTYSLVESYRLARGQVYHFDLYRMHDPLELESIGFRDYMDDAGICLIEWPEKALEQLGDPDVMLVITGRKRKRHVTLQAVTSRGEAMLNHLRLPT